MLHQKIQTELTALESIYSLLVKTGKFEPEKLAINKPQSSLMFEIPSGLLSIKVIPSMSKMRNTHRHTSKTLKRDALLNRWEVSANLFWDVGLRSKKSDTSIHSDYYIFHSAYNPDQNIIVSAAEMILVMHKRIDHYLMIMQLDRILPEHLNGWDLCDL